MKTIYQFKILTYVLSILSILIAFFLLVFGVITWATNTMTTSFDNRLEDYYGTDITIKQFYSDPASADEILYMRFQRNGIDDYASYNYQTADIYVSVVLPAGAVELPGFLYFTDGFTVMSIALIVGTLSFVLLIVTIVAHVQGNKQRRTEIKQSQSSPQTALEEANSLFERGLLTEEEYEQRKDNILNKL